MSTQTQSDQLVERLRPVRIGIRADLEISRHIFGGEAAYVLRDPISFHSHRLSPEDYQIFAAIDAQETLQQTFARLERRGLLQPDQEKEFYRFILELGQMGLLNLPLTDGHVLYQRFARRRKVEEQAAWWSLLFLRIPLVHPDRFLSLTLAFVGFLFQRTAFYVWLIGMLLSVGYVGLHWNQFQVRWAEMLAFGNLPLMWVLLVTLKALHELGHAYACKQFGGKVPEIGVFLVLFTPCAYVDASAAWGFPRRRDRLVVSLGGMYFESWIAMFAVLVWALSGPGTTHNVAQYVIVLASVVTIGFNANPFMKYDGYYILTDLVGAPNLRADAQLQVTSWIREWLGGTANRQMVAKSSRKTWVLIYGLISSAYRWLLLIGLASAMAWKIPVVGLLLAAVYLSRTIFATMRWLRLQVVSMESAAMRWRASLCGMVACAGLASLMLLFPSPYSMQASGSLERQHSEIIRANTAGFLSEVRVRVGEELEPGTTVCRLENVETQAQVDRKNAEVNQLAIQWASQLAGQPRLAAMVSVDLKRARQEAQLLAAWSDELIVRSPRAGVLAQNEPLRQVGRFVKRGETLAHVISGPWVVRSWVRAEMLADLQPRIGQRVTIRTSDEPATPRSGTIERIIPMARHESGTSEVNTNEPFGLADGPQDRQRGEAYFEVVVRFDENNAGTFRHGAYASVRFPGAQRCLGQSLWRRVLGAWNSLRATS